MGQRNSTLEWANAFNNVFSVKYCPDINEHKKRGTQLGAVFWKLCTYIFSDSFFIQINEYSYDYSAIKFVGLLLYFPRSRCVSRTYTRGNTSWEGLRTAKQQKLIYRPLRFSRSHSLYNFIYIQKYCHFRYISLLF